MSNTSNATVDDQTVEKLKDAKGIANSDNSLDITTSHSSHEHKLVSISVTEGAPRLASKVLLRYYLNDHCRSRAGCLLDVRTTCGHGRRASGLSLHILPQCKNKTSLTALASVVLNNVSVLTG